MLCAAPLVVPRFSAYNVEETKGNGGECCLHIAIGMDMPTEASMLVTASELPFRSPHFHAFGKAYPGPNLLQVVVCVLCLSCLFVYQLVVLHSVNFCLRISKEHTKNYIDVNPH